MLVFVDESGDTGFRFGQGSRTYFVVTMVIFGDDSEADRVRERIDALRQEMNLPQNYEFHFVRNNPSVRRAFFKAVSRFASSYTALVVDKRRLPEQEFNNRFTFYQSICGVALESVKPMLLSANVQFDDSDGKAAKRELASYLKRKINQGGLERIRRVGTQNSKGNSLIQLADMICGAVYRSYQDDESGSLARNQEYRNLLKHRELSVLHWPV